MEPVDPGALRIVPGRDTLAAGAEVQLVAVLVSDIGDTLPAEGVLWSSSNPDIASVTAGGLVVGKASGTASIVALTPDDRAEAMFVVERRFKATAVSVGNSHVCALALDGKAWCFGSDVGGSLGLGTVFPTRTTAMTSPVMGGHTFTMLSTNWSTTCGLATDGRIWCWGWGYGDGLGHFTSGELTAIPVIADTLRTYQYLAGGASHHCGLSSGELFCWGLSYGQPRSPFRDSGFEWATMSLAAWQDCGVTTAHELLCWQPDVFPSPSSPTSGAFSTVSSAFDWDGRDPYACAVRADGTLVCWGSNAHGQLGDGTTTARNSPAAVSASERFSTVTTAPEFVCGLSQAGAAHCWGSNDHGQLGRWDSTSSLTPVAAETSNRFLSISTGHGSYSGYDENRVCAVSTEHELFCWGEGIGPLPTPILY